MPESSFRVVAILKAKVGQERALLDFALNALDVIRSVDGLREVELSQSRSDPGQLVLYYWWESAEHSQSYLGGQIYSQIAPSLERLVQEHLLVGANLISG
jgi:quinol monooxygenase YgiN